MFTRTLLFSAIISLFLATHVFAQDNSANESLVFEFGKVNIPVGPSVRVPVTVANFNAISGFQYSIHLEDTSRVCFAGVDNFNLLGLNQNSFSINNGVITCIWLDNDLAGISLPDSTIIYEVLLNVKQRTEICTAMLMRGEPTDSVAIQIINNDAVKIPITAIAGEVCTKQGTATKEVFQTLGTIRPNPSTDYLVLDFELRKSSRVSLQLNSLSGQQTEVYLNKEFYQNGVHQLTVSVANLPSGVYWMRLQTEDAVWVEKIVKE